MQDIAFSGNNQLQKQLTLFGKSSKVNFKSMKQEYSAIIQKVITLRVHVGISQNWHFGASADNFILEAASQRYSQGAQKKLIE